MMFTRTLTAAMAAALFMIPALMSTGAHAAPFALSHRVNNPQPGTEDQFGRALDVSGGTAIVGTWADDGSGTNTGRAYLVDTATGGITHTLVNPSPTSQDRFGWDVGIDGNRAIVGAYLEDGATTNQGEAYIFNTVTGAFETTLVNPNRTGNSEDRFGWSVDISGDLAVVGSVLDDPSGVSGAGRAYLFDAVNGTLLHELLHPSLAAGDQFGHDVAVDGNLVAVSSRLDDFAGRSNAGSVHVFNATTGALETSIFNPNPTNNDYFGFSIDIDDGKLLVGTPYEDIGPGDNPGRAYMFDALTGDLLQTFGNPSSNTNDYFGRSVSLSGGFAAIGAGYDNPFGVDNAGSASIFDTVTGDLLQWIASPTRTNGQLFSGAEGDGLAIDGGTLVVGAWGNDTNATNAGRAYIYNAEIQQSGVPAPGAVLLLGAGLLGLGFRRSRTNHKRHHIAH